MNETFINGIVQFRVLERPQFSAVQTKIFPIYFSMQSAIPAVLALTFPGTRTNLPWGEPSGLAGVFAASNRWGVTVPLGTMFATGLLNLLVLLPATQKCMADRRLQGEWSPPGVRLSLSVQLTSFAEKKDGKKSWDPPPQSQEMLELNKRFGMLHGVSSLLNLVTFIATVVYGITLSRRLQ